MIDKFFGDRITELRSEKGVSEVEMSLALGRSKTYIWNIAAYKSYAGMETFFDICDYLKVTPTEFFEPSASSENIALLKMFESLSSQDKRVIMRIMKGLKENKE